MANPDVARDGATSAGRAAAFRDALAVYLQPRVLIVLFLGFSSGLPLALSGSTLIYWAAEAGVNLRTVGLFALVGAPYTFKFFWAPMIDALDVPVLARWLGRRRGWLVFSQLILIATILFVGAFDPVAQTGLIAAGALALAAASATQDIVVDAFRIESLPENEQAAGMAAYVAAYRVGMLASSAGALYAVSGVESFGFSKAQGWTGAYAAMAVLVLIGIAATLFATEPEKSAIAEQKHREEKPLHRILTTTIGAFRDFFLRDRFSIILAALLFVVLFKLTDALAGVMTGPFTIELGFSRVEYTTIVKGVGFAATLIGGFAGGYVARAYPLAASLWFGGLIQALANLAFSWQAIVGRDLGWLTVAITLENFTSALGTVIFVAYLSALCRNSIQTATQYALLTALAAVGRIFIPAVAGNIAVATGWTWFFVVCALAAIPGLLVLALLQYSGHFTRLAEAAEATKH